MIAVILGLVAFGSTFTLVLLNHGEISPQNSRVSMDLRAQFLSPKQPRNSAASRSRNARNETLVVAPIGIEHFFWRGRQNRLVKLIRNVTNNDGNHHAPVLLNFTIRCKVLLEYTINCIWERAIAGTTLIGVSISSFPS
jgi:hypothetical protein